MLQRRSTKQQRGARDSLRTLAFNGVLAASVDDNESDGSIKQLRAAETIWLVARYLLGDKGGARVPGMGTN